MRINNVASALALKLHMIQRKQKNLALIETKVIDQMKRLIERNEVKFLLILVDCVQQNWARFELLIGSKLLVDILSLGSGISVI